MKIVGAIYATLFLFVVLVLTILGIYVYVKRKEIAKALAPFNPASSENVVNKGVNTVVTAATGREETFGGWLAEMFDPSTRAAREMLAQKPQRAPAEPSLPSDFFFGAP